MFYEFSSHLFVHGVMLSELKRNHKHCLAIECHPCCAIGLLKSSPCWQRRAPVKYANIVKTKKSSFENVFSGEVFPVYPPREIEKQFMKNCFKKNRVCLSPNFFFYCVHIISCPRVYRWIY